MLFESKKWRPKVNTVPQKKTDLPIICLPWHFRGSGHTETYFWNKISGLPWNFQPPRCHSRRKNDKKRWKKRGAFLPKKTDLPIICLPWHFRGSGHTKTYFWNKISFLLWNFQPPRCHLRWKNDKKGWKKRSAFLPKKTYLPIFWLPWHFQGSGHTKAYFGNKNSGLPSKFQPPKPKIAFDLEICNSQF